MFHFSYRKFFWSFCILLSFSSQAQWTQYSGISIDNIEAVRPWDSNVIYASQPEKMLRSTDAGLTWVTLPIVNSSGTVYFGVNFYDFEVLSPGVIVAVGILSLGNNEIILKSSDYGVTWQTVSSYSSGAWPRVQNAVTFVSANTGFTVGSNGRMLKTSNGGATWSALSSGVGVELKDVCFTSTTTGFAVGQGKVLKTTNGGTSWSNTSFSGSFFYAVHFPSANVGYAVGEDRKIIKTTNGGTSWTTSTMNTPFNFTLTSVYFVSDTEGYVTGDNGTIYHTTTGGQYWEKTEMVNDLNDVYFSSPTNGYLAGDIGQLKHTSNGGQIYHPMANFSFSPSVSCNDSIISLTNLSDPSLSYQWLLNGVPFSTNYNAQVTISNPSQIDTISLVAFNGTYYDTLSKNVNIQESLEFSISGGIQTTQICSGQSTNMYVYNSIPGIVYSLTKNGTLVGTTQYGNGGTLTFNSGATYVNSNLCVKGVKSVSGCGSNIETWCTTLMMQNPDPATLIQFVEDTVCAGSSAQIKVYNSQVGVSYQLYNNSFLVGLPQTGNGSNLTFYTFPNSSNTPYYIKGISPLGCETTFPTMVITVQSPSVYWTAETQNPEVGEPIDFINNSLYPQGSFMWNFGANASPTTSTLSDPTNVTFNTPGVQNVSLTFVTPLGCTQTISKQINVINPFIPGSCEAVNLNSTMPFTSHLYAINRDKDMNMYTVYKQSLDMQNRVYSNHGDSLNLGLPPIANFNNSYTLIKHNPKGVPMWAVNLRSNTDGRGGEVITDTNGNVYMAYYHDDYFDSLRIYSSDGRFISTMPPHYGSSFNSVVIVKYDPNGNYLWHTTFLDEYTCEKISLKLDDEQNLFASGVFRAVKYNPAGVLQWETTGYIADIEPDNEGGVYILHFTDLIVDHFNATGSLINSSPTPVTLLPNTVIASKHMAQDENGDLYLFGNLRGSFLYALDTLSDPFNFGQVHEDVFLAKMSRDYEQLWIKQFKGPEAMSLQGIDILDNTVMIGFKNDGMTMEYIQGDTLFPNATQSYFLFKCDTLGTTDELSMFYDGLNGYLGSSYPYDNLVLSDGGSKFDFGFEYAENFTASTGTQFVYYPTSGFNNYGINLADVSCVFNETPPTDIPIAYFDAPVNICIGETINFTDGSINNPTQWNWTFAGGSITTSNNQHPTVTFSTIGSFPITLTATNNFGQSEVYYSYVNVAALPSAVLDGSPAVCEGFYGTVCATSTDQIVWSNGTTYYCLNVLAPVGDTVVSVTVSNPNCSVQLFYTITVEPTPIISLNGILPDTVCSTEPPFLLPPATPAGGTYMIIYNEAINNYFDPSTIVSPDNNIPITYTYTSPSGACTASYAETIYVKDGQTWLGVYGDTSGCISSNLNFYTSASSNTTDFLWDFDGGISSDSTSYAATVSFNQVGTYLISVTASAATCPGQIQSLTVTIDSSENVVIDPFITSVICAPSTIPVALPWASPAGGYYYDTQGAINSYFQIDPTLMMENVTNYVYYVYNNGNGCTGIDSTEIIVSNLSNAITLNGELYGCEGSELDFYAIAPANVTNYSWDFDGGVSPNNTLPNTTAIFDLAGTYNVSLIANDGVCSSPIEYLVVTVDPAPIVEIDSFITSVICAPATNLISVPSGFPLNGTYYDSQGAMINNLQIDPSLMMANVTNYIYYVYNDGNGCTGLDSTDLTLSDLSGAILINGEQSGCEGSELDFYATTSTNVTNYLWDFDGGVSPNNTIPITTAIFDQAGTYNVSLTANNGFCSSPTEYLVVTIDPTPLVEIDTFVTSVICAPATNLISLPAGTPINGTYYDAQGAVINQTTIDPSLMTLNVLNYIYYSFDSGNSCIGLDSTTLLLSDCLGLGEQDSGNAIYISIGETSGSFIIKQLEFDSEIVIYNSIGQIIRQYETESEEFIIDLSSESTGMYLLNIRMGNDQKVFRIYNE